MPQVSFPAFWFGCPVATGEKAMAKSRDLLSRRKDEKEGYRFNNKKIESRHLKFDLARQDGKLHLLVCSI